MSTMTRCTPRGRAPVLVAVAVLSILVPGSAVAYWPAGGSGSGSGSTGTPTPVTLSPGTPGTQLYPGGVADVALSIDNPNPGPVRVESLALDTSQGTGGFAVDGDHAGCDLSALAFATQANGGAGWDLPGGGSVAVTLTDALSMSEDAHSDCQGASFTVYLKAGA